ncbi:D-TA family PLP-dependent enzyme [Pedobacter aquatilis]|uniref:D-TA family PLP-dependent enzyme n=1 Tax=Pedobacter aquatilis TaxID=351343 RepID=UPI0025B4FD76|nr:D-TA family PLP-dependent enzyme [Pedobacter aquatilis]MDN3585281.1 D-TA family PLP-dependent enzyme [Pedobacter aquatilis]
MQQQDWFILTDEASLETPSLIFYIERIKHNIKTLKTMIDDVGRLRPHVKTHKCLEVTNLMIAEGINKFKCATIAEAQMLGMANAKDVLLAYPPVGENINRFLKLQKTYSSTVFSCLVDDLEIAEQLSAKATSENRMVNVYIDLNVGMNRTGILPDLAMALVKSITALPNLNLKGFHAYDGHIHDSSMDVRKQKSQPIIKQINQLKLHCENISNSKFTIIAGGTPTFPIYSTETDFECSPGTFVLWDKGYQDAYPEQKFEVAALVVSRIVSKPADGFICTDLGHKAVAAEKELQNRVFFVNAPNLEIKSQSEEHLVLTSDNPNAYKIGDVLYGLPYHVCPTVALHEKAVCLDEIKDVQYWDIISRKRKITI